MTRGPGGDWAIAVPVSAVAAALLVSGSVTGRPQEVAAAVVAAVLACLPDVPLTRAAALPVVAERCAGILAGTGAGLLAWPQLWGVPAVVATAALAGRLRPPVGPGAALAAVLVPVVAEANAAVSGGAAMFAAAAVGCLVTLAVTAARPAGPAAPEPVPMPVRFEHPVRYALAVAGAVTVVVWLAPVVPGIHWVATALLLTVRDTPRATRKRWRERVLGNSVGAVVAAGVLVLHPATAVRAFIAGLLLAVALGLRRRTYLAWAVAAPPALLIVAEFAHPISPVDGALRVGLNVVGGAIALAVTSRDED